MQHSRKPERSPKRTLTVIARPIATLKLDPRNARVHSPRQIRQIAASIEAFGFNVPVLIDAAGQVIAGHGRLLACAQLGWQEVPTIRLEHLSAAQARAYMIADNRLSENASWDEQLLAEQLRDLSLAELDFSIEVTGFEMAEIDLLIEGLAPTVDGESDPAEAIPAAGPAVSQAGDLWLLGAHRVYCASAVEAASYAQLFGE